ncbi:hypothetical protein M758_1G288700 [Ceratodon purpureus]|nr:hypothetical protein M758_1G288700 [Ceratodon purpureus]
MCCGVEAGVGMTMVPLLILEVSRLSPQRTTVFFWRLERLRIDLQGSRLRSACH